MALDSLISGTDDWALQFLKDRLIWATKFGACQLPSVVVRRRSYQCTVRERYPIFTANLFHIASFRFCTSSRSLSVSAHVLSAVPLAKSHSSARSRSFTSHQFSSKCTSCRTTYAAQARQLHNADLDCFADESGRIEWLAR